MRVCNQQILCKAHDETQSVLQIVCKYFISDWWLQYLTSPITSWKWLFLCAITCANGSLTCSAVFLRAASALVPTSAKHLAAAKLLRMLNRFCKYDTNMSITCTCKPYRCTVIGYRFGCRKETTASPLGKNLGGNSLRNRSVHLPVPLTSCNGSTVYHQNICRILLSIWSRIPTNCCYWLRWVNVIVIQPCRL